MDLHVGYCTNVHAGRGLAEMQANLRRHATEVKKKCSPNHPMGVGLWLSAVSARELRKPDSLEPFRDWLREVELTPYTLNGFPYGDFHQDVVKHLVYQPTWMEPARVEYTRDLIAIQDGLLPDGLQGSISTLPICWGAPSPSAEKLAVEHLRQIAACAAELEQESGRLIYVCIEPEPGCHIQRTDDMIGFFENHLLGENDEEIVRRHIRVCHDICHASVMFESQRDVFQRYQAAGISIGKVQVSSAVCLRADSADPRERKLALAQLAAFGEDRYLHQTSVRTADGRSLFFEDLPEALQAASDPAVATGEWRVHFHVPVYLERFGQLGTSRDDIIECLRAAEEFSDVQHYEVETYAWNVLPPELQVEHLADGIAQELTWFAEQQKNR